MPEYKYLHRNTKKMLLVLLLICSVLFVTSGACADSQAEAAFGESTLSDTAAEAASGESTLSDSAAEAASGESSLSDSSAEESGEQSNPYVLNKWGYVDYSMDISQGIPSDALGRLGRIRDKGVLTVATEPYYAPQEFIDTSLPEGEQYVGSDIELAKRIAERMGVSLRLIPLDFTVVLEMTKNGRFDLAISGLAYTPGRASTMTLSKGYHFSESANTGVLIRKEDAEKITSLDDLSGEDIVAQSGSLQEMLLSEHISKYKEFRRLSSMTEIYKELMEGIAAAAAVDIETAEIYLKNNPECGLTLLDGVSFSLEEQYQGDRVAAAANEEELIAFVNGVIDEVLESGEYAKWFEEYSEYAAELKS